MKSTFGWKLLVVVLCLVFLAGCAPQDEQIRKLKQDNTGLRSDISDLKARNSQLSGDVTDAEQARELADLEAERWKTQYNAAKDLAPSGTVMTAEILAKFREIARSGKHWTYSAGVLRAQSDILFASGKADLKPEAQAAIAEVAPALKEILTDKSLALRVDGHTDVEKITRSGWKDNLQLSLARARAVAVALQEQGVPAEVMYAAGFGEYRPLPGETVIAKNRRVELVIVPR